MALDYDNSSCDDDYGNAAASLVRKWLDWAFTLAAACTHGHTRTLAYKVVHNTHYTGIHACNVRAHTWEARAFVVGHKNNCSDNSL